MLFLESFVYDLHIGHFENYMKTKQEYTRVDFLKLLNYFVRRYHDPPKGAKNAIFKGMLRIKISGLGGVTAGEIFQYFRLNCNKYNFSTLKHRNLEQCVFSRKD
mmetsp:Transcript_8746/g.4744  ORF Transcript_8746/g.4744 Transcript_8746/m.4744 type:complete len:104 (-) Transcript_8746:86-397(-)